MFFVLFLKKKKFFIIVVAKGFTNLIIGNVFPWKNLFSSGIVKATLNLMDFILVEGVY